MDGARNSYGAEMEKVMDWHLQLGMVYARVRKMVV